MSSRPGPPVDLSALSGLAPELAEMLVSVACDIALVLDEGGVIRSIAHGASEPVGGTSGEWLGRCWTDTVTGDTRDKAKAFLGDLATTGVSRLRHLNHASAAGQDIPIAYTAVRLGDQGPTLAVGRDLRMVTAMQQRLVQVQQDMERDYWQRRQAETRYRLLFQVATEPVLVVDAATLNVIDANRAAAVLFGRSVEQLNGQSVTEGIDPAAREALCALLESARGSDKPVEGQTSLVYGLGRLLLSVTSFEADAGTVLLVRARPADCKPGHPSGESMAAQPVADTIFAGLIHATPDAVVISDLSGRIVLVNQSFRELVQLPASLSIRGNALSDWIGCHDMTFQDILSAVRCNGRVRLLQVRLRRQLGLHHARDPEREIDVELSAALIVDHDCVGYIVRAVHAHAAEGLTGNGSLNPAVH